MKSENESLTSAITRVEVLTAEECVEVFNTVQNLKSHWLRRSGAPFFSLGAASYLDAKPGDLRYYEMAAHFNPVLREHLGWLYDRLLSAISHQFQTPACYVPKFALPGFHIFQADPAFEYPFAETHCDLQYKKLDWSDFAAPDFNTPISFTLSIALPKSGGGLRVWNVDYDEIVGLNVEALRMLFKSRQRSYEPYQVGSMVIHSGHAPHQIAPMQNMQPDDERITLQGHAIAADGIWYLYW